uniref:Uncharacterized protein n=1 Tax=Anguilla anguilla TaxID=7936 RepID=A0A0E9WLK7_ANGAN
MVLWLVQIKYCLGSCSLIVHTSTIDLWLPYLLPHNGITCKPLLFLTGYYK